MSVRPVRLNAADRVALHRRVGLLRPRVRPRLPRGGRRPRRRGDVLRGVDLLHVAPRSASSFRPRAPRRRASTRTASTGRRPCGSWAGMPHDRGWLAAATQFPGTLFFNISTLAALTHNATAAESDRYVWRPDLYGSILFLVASAFGILAVSGRFLAVESRSVAWWIGLGQHARLGPVHGLCPGQLRPAEHRRAREHPAVRGRDAARCRVLPRRCRPDVPRLATGAHPVPRHHPKENRMTTPPPARTPTPPCSATASRPGRCPAASSPRRG